MNHYIVHLHYLSNVSLHCFHNNIIEGGYFQIHSEMVSSRQPFIIYQLEWYSPVEYQCHVNNNMWCSHTLAIDHCSTWTTYPIQLVLTKGRQAVLNRSIDLDRESYLRQRVSPPWNNKNKGPTWDRAPPPAVTYERTANTSLSRFFSSLTHRMLM